MQTIWTNLKKSPQDVGFYRLTRCAGSLEFFAYWNGVEWFAPSTSADGAKLAVRDKRKSTNQTPEVYFWRELEKGDARFFGTLPENNRLTTKSEERKVQTHSRVNPIWLRRAVNRWHV